MSLETALELSPEPSSERPRVGGRGLRLRRDWPVLLGGSVLAIFILAAILAPVLPLDKPNAVDPVHALAPIFSAGHALGTDQLGRDVLSRIVWGARISLPMGIFSTAGSAIVGVSVGMLAGYVGGWTDEVLMRAIDTIMGLPLLLLAIAVITMLGPGLVNAMIAIAIVGIPFYARMSRALVVRLKSRPYIEASRIMGTSHAAIVRTHIVPHLIAPVAVFASVDVGYKIIATAGLSFLGLGTQPPTADWGTMLADGRDSIFVAPLLVTIPGIAIALVVLSFNLIGDWLRDRTGT